MKHIEIPGSGSFVAAIDVQDEDNYYFSAYGVRITVPKDIVIDWDTTRYIPHWWNIKPDYQIDDQKRHLVRFEPHNR